jgi:hypothetical protein
MFATCLVGGPFHGRTRDMQVEPAKVLVMPHEDGFFLRYRRSNDQPPHVEGEKRTIVYVFVERFEGDREVTRAAKPA